MRRRLFILLSVFSLLLFVAVCMLWVRSHFRFDQLVIDDEDNGILGSKVICLKGIVRVVRIGGGSTVVGAGRRWHLWSGRPDDAWDAVFDRWSPTNRFLGFGYQATLGVTSVGPSASIALGASVLSGADIPETIVVQFPLWFAVAVTSWMPCLAARKMIQRRRRALNHLCPTCGYDLRATPNRCPECGSDVLAQTT